MIPKLAAIKTFCYRYAAVGLFVGLGGVLWLVAPWEYLHQQQTDGYVPVAEDYEVEGPILPKSEPKTLRIPKLNLTIPFEAPLGLLANGEVEPPRTYEQVGRYQYGPTPGELGPAVVLGHVDSLNGPAVFFYLGQLEEGDDIFIDREDGTTAHFVVSELEREKQSAFPTAKVYGDINHAGLRLITCSGTFEKGEQRYSHNLIVYAKLIE